MSGTNDQLSFDNVANLDSKASGLKGIPSKEEILPPPKSEPDIVLWISLFHPDGLFRCQWRYTADPEAFLHLEVGCFMPDGKEDQLIQVLDKERKVLSQWGANPGQVHKLIQWIRKYKKVTDAGVHFTLCSKDRSMLGMKKGVHYCVSNPWAMFENLLNVYVENFKQFRFQLPFQTLQRKVVSNTIKSYIEGSDDEDDEQTWFAYDLHVTFDQVNCQCFFSWISPDREAPACSGRVNYLRSNEMEWRYAVGNKPIKTTITSFGPDEIKKMLSQWLKNLDLTDAEIAVTWLIPNGNFKKVFQQRLASFSSLEAAFRYLEQAMICYGDYLRSDRSRLWEPSVRAKVPSPKVVSLKDLGRLIDFPEFPFVAFNLQPQPDKPQPDKPQPDKPKPKPKPQNHPPKTGKKQKTESATKPPDQQPRIQWPLPAIPTHFQMPPMEFQETSLPLTNLRGINLREKASLWWVSNQSDDLLCLPFCRIQKLDYQIRTALRVLGPLRGRALLSDEVGLGKTIEAGLIIKELFTRGMVKRFLVLTVPSLVDQWQEELEEKFSLNTATTNQPLSRSNPEQFWKESTGIVASLHTLKQPAHLQIAKEVQWDILVVDEAHYLRNRDSLAWQAVNVLPRHYLLLLTATPVQNSLEELYNLVTLLQPGQLLSPKEFRARYIDPKRPRQPKEPEELRRLLGQVMIRNTRANAGINLPPRRAESVIFEPDEKEKVFWQQWEPEFRQALSRLDASKSSLWGRLVLQAAGSSPAAWRDVLENFPNQKLVKKWRDESPLEGSWKRKCELLAPLTQFEGGAVVFTQFLETQAALAAELRKVGVDVFVINGSTPAPERQPITEKFRKAGGALLLSHSGAEGRNLQFSHHLANFDLPWNPMEIEQRIGRVHRLGQNHPVRIHNFVQAGTLQEHLLDILQEKLNLFELVVGETGLILGEKFSSDEFAEEVLRRWRENEGKVGKAFEDLGEELASARDQYQEVKQLDETLFAKDYESV